VGYGGRNPWSSARDGSRNQIKTCWKQHFKKLEPHGILTIRDMKELSSDALKELASKVKGTGLAKLAIAHERAKVALEGERAEKIDHRKGSSQSAQVKAWEWMGGLHQEIEGHA
jgi:hypothetical protein